jgi:hypothetical protein
MGNALTAAIVLITLVSSSAVSAAMQMPAQRIAGQQDYPGLDIQVSLGWEGLQSPNAPLAVSLLITNHSAAVLSGQVVLRIPQTGAILELGEVTVGPGSVRHFGSVAHLNEIEGCELRWEGTDGMLWARQLLLQDRVFFETADRLLLFVEAGQRNLTFPPVSSARAKLANSNPGGDTAPTPPVGADSSGAWAERGSKLQVIRSQPWQLPVHPGPLTQLHTVLLSPLIRPEDLTDLQWNALAQWVALGGYVMVPAESTNILGKLQEQLPCKSAAATTEGILIVHRCGLGAIEAYPAADLGKDGTPVMQAIADAAATRICRSLFETLRNATLYRYSDGFSWAYMTASFVVALSGLYAVATALPIFMFRASRRWVVGWLVTVVIVGTVAAAVVGLVMRKSPADAVVTTVTEVGEGSLVQAAAVQLTSAGNRQSTLKIRGRQPEMQVNSAATSMGSDWRSAWQTTEDGFMKVGRFSWAAFDLQKNIRSDLTSGSMPISLLPWRSRTITAVDFAPIEGQLQVKLSDVDAGGTQPQAGSQVHISQYLSETLSVLLKYQINVQSTLPYEIAECTLSATLWKAPLNEQDKWSLYTASSDVMIDRRDGSANRLLAIGFDHLPENEVYYDTNWFSETALLPKGEVTVWLVAKIDRSPIMQLDHSAGDTASVDDGEHWLIYRVPLENLPMSWQPTR